MTNGRVWLLGGIAALVAFALGWLVAAWWAGLLAALVIGAVVAVTARKGFDQRVAARGLPGRLRASLGRVLGGGDHAR